MTTDNFVSPCAVMSISSNEMDEVINKFGAFITLLTNKPISCVTMFLLIQENPALRDILVDMCDTSWYSVVEYLAWRYPILNKSKKVK